MNRIMSLGLAVCVGCAASLMSFGDIRAVTPVPQNAETNSWWMKRFNEKQKLVRAGGSKVVFIGDSITHFWEGRGQRQWNRYFAEPYGALNLGYSADRTEHVLWRIAHGELDGYEAKAIVLMIGTNNSGHFPREKETPIDTVIGIRAVIDAIRAKQPNAKLIVCPIFPRGVSKDDPYRRRNGVVNHEIKRFADGKNVFWCDFTEQFLTADGTLPAEVMPDYLHPGAYGYELWASAVLPYVEAAVRGAAMPPNRFASHASEFFTVAKEGPSVPLSLIGRREGWWREEEMWFKRLKEHRAEMSEANGEFDAVFLGDSITRGWEGNGGKVLAELRQTYKIHSLGIGGDRVQHNIWRVRNGELEGYRTKLVMLMIGTNNNYGDRPEAVAAGIKVLLADIREKQPQAKVLLLPVFPRGQFPTDKMRVQNATVSGIIRGYADGKSVIWVDFRDKLLQADGTISKDLMPDFLHPKEEGYRIWAEAIRPYLKEATGK